MNRHDESARSAVRQGDWEGSRRFTGTCSCMRVCRLESCIRRCCPRPIYTSHALAIIVRRWFISLFVRLSDFDLKNNCKNKAQVLFEITS